MDSPEDTEIDEIISLVSTYTCWANEACDTFLLGERREVIDLPSCIDCGFEFEPFYHPFDENSFEFKVVKQMGYEVTEETVTAAYNYSTGKFIVDTGLPSCKCKTRSCNGCEPKYNLVVTYDAGYEELPNCLLPMFCNILDVIKAKNKCDCEKDCSCNSNGEDDVQYATGDVVTVQIETDIGKMIVEQYKRQLSLIALCDKQQLWGLVV